MAIGLRDATDYVKNKFTRTPVAPGTGEAQARAGVRGTPLPQIDPAMAGGPPRPAAQPVPPAASAAPPAAQPAPAPRSAPYRAGAAMRSAFDTVAPAAGNIKSAILPESSGGLKGALGTGAKVGGTVAGGALLGASLWQPLADDSSLSTSQKLKLLGTEGLKAAGGIIGTGAGAVLGTGAAPGLGTVVGGMAGGVAGYNATDAALGGLRRSANAVNGWLGGDPNYITSTEDDLKKAGFGGVFNTRQNTAAPAAAAAVPAALSAAQQSNSNANLMPLEQTAQPAFAGLRNQGPANSGTAPPEAAGLQRPAASQNPQLDAALANALGRNEDVGNADNSFLGEIRQNLNRKHGLRKAQVIGDQLIQVRGQDMRNTESMYGHDVSRENNRNSVDASRDNAAATRNSFDAKTLLDERHRQRQGLRDEKNDARQADLDGQAEDNKALDNRLKVDEALMDRSIQLTKNSDGTENPERANRRAQGVSVAVNAQIEKLLAKGDKRGAATLREKGAAAGGAGFEADLDQGLEIMERFQQRKGWFGGAEGKVSNNPLDYLPRGVSKDGKKVIMGSEGNEMEMDYEDIESMDLPWLYDLFGMTGGPNTNKLTRGLREPK
jgi:hypothetical protein